jgi:catechol 2,3-dioxygenase-like lactoylglutathione lyase family enzyme
MASIIGIDHVQVAMPPGGEALARRFYGGVLGLPELAKPANLAVRGGLWFSCGPLQLHLGGEQNFQAAKKAHPALLVDDLDGFLPGLVAHGIELRHEEAIAGAKRIAIADPFGNRVELVERLAASPDARATR